MCCARAPVSVNRSKCSDFHRRLPTLSMTVQPVDLSAASPPARRSSNECRVVNTSPPCFWVVSANWMPRELFTVPVALRDVMSCPCVRSRDICSTNAHKSVILLPVSRVPAAVYLRTCTSSLTALERCRANTRKCTAGIHTRRYLPLPSRA